MRKRKAQDNLNSMKVVLSELFFDESIGPVNLSQRLLTVGDIEFPEKGPQTRYSMILEVKAVLYSICWACGMPIKGYCAQEVPEPPHLLFFWVLEMSRSIL